MPWVICGVLVFVLLSTVTLVVLVRNPPVSRVPSSDPVPMRATALTTPSPTPTPKSLPSAADSRLTSVTLGESTCAVRLRRDVVPDHHLDTYLESLVDCLMQSYEGPFAEAGLSLSRPSLSPESALEDSGCVTDKHQPDDWAGLYCSADTTIYYRTDWTSASALNHVEVITHEFAHHLQHEADVLRRVSRAQRRAETQPNGAAEVQQLSRRVELQAECLSGAMMGPDGPLPVQRSELAGFLEARAAVPPEWAATHGTGRAQTRWFRAGVESTGPHRLAVCNTFTAAAALVE